MHTNVAEGAGFQITNSITEKIKTLKFQVGRKPGGK
jgi:hypothetical protein